MDADPIVLSSGSFDESVFGLPESLKACIRFPLERNWYGYSDSLGRGSAREALAALETARFAGASSVDPSEIAVTLGGTAAVSAVVDFLVDHGASTPGRALCAVPNYPPLVATVARRLPVSMVPAFGDRPIGLKQSAGSRDRAIGVHPAAAGGPGAAGDIPGGGTPSVIGY